MFTVSWDEFDGASNKTVIGDDFVGSFYVLVEITLAKIKLHCMKSKVILSSLPTETIDF